MNTNDNQPRIEVKVDRRLAWYQGDSVRYICIDVTAPNFADNDARTDRKPLNLGVVVDASGSMASGELQAAKVGLLGILEALGNDDMLSVVSFDEDVTVHFARQRVGAERSGLARPIGRIHTGGTTNLSGGWLKGAEQVALGMEAHPDFRHRVFLLSDGHANRGITEPGELAAHAEQLRVRRLMTSAIGIGDGYSPLQLEAIAAHGGGRMHRAATASEVTEVMLGELAESENIAVEDMMIALGTPPGARAEMLSAFPTVRAVNGLTTTLGSLGSATSVRAIVRVTLPAGNEKELLTFSVDASWMVPGESARARCKISEAATIQLVQGRVNNVQPRDVEASCAVVAAWEAVIVREAVARNRAGDFGGASAYVAEQLHHLERYCDGLPGTSQVLANVRRLQMSIDRPWAEGNRLEAYAMAYKQSRHEREVRAGRHQWADALPPKP